jgi:formamidopyrimidine-DNA glycosylase
MPELPEVEITVREIQAYVEGQVIKRAVVRQRQLRWPIPRGLNRYISGKKILSVGRRAKYILLTFSHGTLMIHLGMSGRLRVMTAEIPATKHDHVDLIFRNARILRLHDPRRFGSVLWVQGDPKKSTLLSNLGPEPFSEEFSGRMLFDKARGRRASIKNFIMNGHIVVGIGNIYANEALFRAGISPKRSAGRVARHRYDRLAQVIRDVLTEAIAAGGTTLRDYLRVTGEPGYFEQALQVYGRAGEPCPHCGNLIQRDVIGQRASYFCVRCQR